MKLTSFNQAMATGEQLFLRPFDFAILIISGIAVCQQDLSLKIGLDRAILYKIKNKFR